MASNINPQVLRVTTVDFCEAVGLKNKNAYERSLIREMAYS